MDIKKSTARAVLDQLVEECIDAAQAQTRQMLDQLVEEFIDAAQAHAGDALRRWIDEGVLAKNFSGYLEQRGDMVFDPVWRGRGARVTISARRRKAVEDTPV